MRIRKRQVPFPLSSLSPVPLPPDPLLHRPPPSDQPNLRPPPILGLRDSLADAQDNDAAELLRLRADAEDEHEEDAEDGGKEREKSNDTRKGAETADTGTDTGVGLQFSSSSSQVGRWNEGERVVPLKKRRGNFETKTSDETAAVEKNSKKIVKVSKMKTKMNKKCLQKNDTDDPEEIGAAKADGNDILISPYYSAAPGAKRKRRGGALMEGSRCSRVNGRGWRCCQPTLVGYSLCEHHLGKGRLRSMNAVRNRSLTLTPAGASPASAVHEPSSGTDQKEISTLGADETVKKEEARDDRHPLMVAKKKIKLGTVKARSISNLLGQTSNVIAAPSADANEQK